MIIERKMQFTNDKLKLHVQRGYASLIMSNNQDECFFHYDSLWYHYTMY